MDLFFLPVILQSFRKGNELLEQSGLELNWDGNALTNTHVRDTLVAAQQLDRGSAGKQPNWRLQAHTFRAFYDSYRLQRMNLCILPLIFIVHHLHFIESLLLQSIQIVQV